MIISGINSGKKAAEVSKEILNKEKVNLESGVCKIKEEMMV